MRSSRIRRLVGWCGIAGPLLLAAYFTAPALVAFPDPRASDAHVACGARKS